MVSRILLHVGPSVANYGVQSSAVVPNIGFASPEFNRAMKYSLEQFRLVTGADETYMPFIIPGGGTAAMESVVSFLAKDSNILIVTNGVFGDRWEGILSRYPVKFKVLRAKAGKAVTTSQIVSELSGGNFDAVTITQVETSTGVRMPMKEIAEAVRPYVKLIIVDGVASIGGERMNASQWDIDVCLTASQKAIGAQTGAGLLVASRSAMEMLRQPSISGYLLDLRNWNKIMENFLSGGGGYFATPPIGTIFSLAESFNRIEEETMDARISRHRTCSEAFRKGVMEMGLDIVALENLRSNTVTGVYIENVDIQKFIRTAMDRGVEFGAGVHPEIKDRYFRVGHMGWVEPSHIIKALNVIGQSLNALGYNIEKDSGTLAAKAVFDRYPEKVQQ